MSKYNALPALVGKDGLARGSVLKANPLMAVIDEVVRIQGRVKSLFANVGIGAELPAMGRLVLNAVLEAEVPPTVPQIGRSLGHPRQVIQRAVNELIAAELIERAANPNHKRADLLRATEKALALKTTADANALAVADAFLSSFNTERCDNIAKELHDLRRAIEHFSRKESREERTP